MDSLLDDLIADAAKLRSVDFIINGKMNTVYYKLLTGKTYDTIKTLSKKKKLVEGVEIEYVDEDVLRVQTIMRQTLNKDGTPVFTIGDDTKLAKIAYDTQCYLASVMGLKSISDIIEDTKEALKKTLSQEL